MSAQQEYPPQPETEMPIKIESKIVDYQVARDDLEPQPPAAPEIEYMHEELKRPEQLEGSSYKIKTPLSDHALYVTINDVVLNAGTEHEQRRPFEVFINSKNMDHFQWIVALTRIISAVFRKGGDCTFMVEELQSVFDPRGGYFKRGGRFMPSLVAEIGEIIERHLKGIGLLEEETLDEHQKAYLAEKRAEYEASQPQIKSGGGGDAEEDSGFPAGAQLCGKCYTQAMVMLDGCLTCLNCAESKCG